MNKVIILSELAASVAELTQSSPEEAESFIRETFRLAAEELEAEGKVEISGIGTFVVTEESVAYAPDAAIAEELNAPFSAFEAIELPEEDSGGEREGEDEPLIDAEHTEEQSAEEIAEAAEFEEREDAVPEPKTQPESETEQESEPDSEQVRVIETASEECWPAPGSSRSAWAWYGWAASCIACLALGWFARDFVPQPPVADRDRAAAEQTVADDYEATEDIEVRDDATVQPVEHAEPTEPEPTITDTVTSQRYLTTMARAHYGRMEFWVYIYEANADKLGHPDRLSAGTVVVIPSASSLGLNPDNEEQISAAERKAREIYARFN